MSETVAIGVRRGVVLGERYGSCGAPSDVALVVSVGDVAGVLVDGLDGVHVVLPLVALVALEARVRVRRPARAVRHAAQRNETQFPHSNNRSHTSVKMTRSTGICKGLLDAPVSVRCANLLLS